MQKISNITGSIIYTASRLEGIANRFVFFPMGTTAASMKILRILDLEGSLSPKQIMELTGNTKSNVSQRLNNLEKESFIIRHALRSGDKRMVVVKLTAKGKARISVINKRMKKAQVRLEEFFTEKEIESHKKFLKKVNMILDQEEKNLSEIFK